MVCELMSIGIRKTILAMICVIAAVVVAGGCAAPQERRDKPREYPVPEMEAQWIRNGEPIEFDGRLWHPLDMTENLLDSEVYYKGDYRGVQFFVEKTDVKPYNRLYTKFTKNKFRVYEPE